ncbi:MAG: hypothetical protein JWN40_4749 [Phycisphaerales bacterium]|nr:hypothetical protein [Phycisphaerales bacterium]
MRLWSWPFLSICAVQICVAASAMGDKGVTLRGAKWSITIEPATLRVVGTPTDAAPPLIISEALPGSHAIAQLRQEGRRVSWRVPLEKLTVEMGLDAGDVLGVHFTSTVEAGECSWPVVAMRSPQRAWILPMFEGVYVPADDEEWAKFLVKDGPLDTTSGLSMPFWGVDCGGRTLTYVLTNQFNNELAFRWEGGRLGATFTHAFTRNHAVKEYGVRIHLGGASPVEPAKIYRRHLIETEQFVSMAEKINRTPDAAKLLGAAHIYLWGNGLISRQDLSNVKLLATSIVEQGKREKPSIGKRIWALLNEETRKLLSELPAKEWADNYDKALVAEQLSAMLERRDFYDADAWHGVELPDAAMELLKRGVAALNEGDICRLNCLLLQSAFPDALKPVGTWGDGLSPKMIQAFADGGLDRLWLGSSDWKGLRDHPDTVSKAIGLGYLIGPYDSFHSIHSPRETDTWETAQFDQKLYETGAVVKADGTKKTGFKKKGFILNCTVARPYVETRVTDLMKQFRCNSWFVDCDADGELFDDYSPDHPATQAQDKDARNARMAWIRDTFGAVIGSERGSSYAAGTIHFAHGMMTPAFGWGDAEMKDKTSKYFLGAYYPPDAPACFFKQVPMKAEYRRVYAEARFRLPLYQTVFHDSVVTTHQWGSGSLKFQDDDHARELLELLYDVPPLYHLNLAAWEKQKESIKRHYAFFSPLHRESGRLPMTDFRWLTDDRRVQLTQCGDTLERVANFGDEPFDYQGTTIPPHAILARRLDSRVTKIYHPANAP